MLFAAVLPLPFRPRASGSTIPVGPPPSLFCTTTAVVSNTNTHHGRRSSNRSIFPFLRSQPRISVAQTVPQPAACATGEDSEHCREPAPALFARGRSKSDVEAGRTQNAQDEGVAVPPQTCSRARSLPNIFSTVYLPCLSKANAPSSPTSFQGSRSRESSPVIVNRHSREPEDDGDESADPVLPRSVRPVSEDPWDALEEVAAFVRGLDSPTSPSSRRDLSFGTPSPKTRPHQIPEVELLPPLSPLWRDTEGCPKTLSACSAEELTNPGSSWQYRREDIVPEVASSVEEKRLQHGDPAVASAVHEDSSDSIVLWSANACTEIGCWSTLSDECPSSPVGRLPDANTVVDNSPQARRRRRQPLVVSNSDQREQLDIVLNLISAREHEASQTPGGNLSCTSAEAVGQKRRDGPSLPIMCRRRRRRPTLVVSNPDEKDYSYTQHYPGLGAGAWSGIADGQVCS